MAGLRKALDRILAATDLEDQVRLYRSGVRQRLQGPRLLDVVGSPGVLSLLGVPGPQRDMVRRTAGGAVEHAFCASSQIQELLAERCRAATARLIRGAAR